MAQDIQVGLIGFGLGGRVFHAPTVHATEGMRLAAILQRSGDAAAGQYPDARIVRSMDELLAVPGLQLVVISTPNETHFDLARRSLLAGCHVVMDKPFATTCAQALELVHLARQQGRMITVYQNRRWDGDFATLRRLISDGALGRMVLFESHFDRFRPQGRGNTWREQPQPGSGVWFDLGPHLVDQALVLFGAPEALWADIRADRPGAGADDGFDVVLYYAGMRAMLRASVFVSAPTPRFLALGSQGSYLKYGLDPQEAALAGGAKPKGPHWGEEPEERWGTLSVLEGDRMVSKKIPTAAGNYVAYYEMIRDAIHSGGPLGVTPQEALNVMHILELAVESSRQRKALPVTLPVV
jgi:predicted dehydrogenase